MKKLVYFIIFICVVFYAAWFAAGQYGKKTISDSLKSQSTDTLKVSFKKISLNGFPYDFSYKIEGLNFKKIYSDQLNIVTTIGDVDLHSDLLTKNIGVSINKFIKMESSDNKVNGLIEFDELAAKTSYTKPILLSIFKTREDFIKNSSNNNGSFTIKDLTIKDLGNDKLLAKIQKLYFSVDSEEIGESSKAKISIDLSADVPKIKDPRADHVSANGALNIIFNKDKEATQFDFDKLTVSDSFFKMTLTVKLNDTNTKDIHGFVDSTLDYSDAYDANNKPIPDDNIILERIFMIASGQNPKNKAQMPITVRAMFTNKNMTFGNMPASLLPLLALDIALKLDKANNNGQSSLSKQLEPLRKKNQSSKNEELAPTESRNKALLKPAA